MARSTLSKKDKKALRKAGGAAWGGKRTVLLLAGLTVLILLATLAFSFLITPGFTPNNRSLLPVGSEAPDFTIQSVNGSNISLGDATGKDATMLVFFASWCPHCNREAPIISDLEGKYDNLRVIMVGIDDQDNQEKVREFVNKYEIKGPAAYDPSLGSTYQASGYPTIYVIDKNKEITAANSGEVPKDVLEGWVEEALGSNS
ncbi:MAG: TlpA family protein disulfide reductase [Rubrobacter sp.]|nr:TlpA family protein disulfide reductase [Rubrobacter sp.]